MLQAFKVTLSWTAMILEFPWLPKINCSKLMLTTWQLILYQQQFYQHILVVQSSPQTCTVAPVNQSSHPCTTESSHNLGSANVSQVLVPPQPRLFIVGTEEYSIAPTWLGAYDRLLADGRRGGFALLIQNGKLTTVFPAHRCLQYAETFAALRLFCQISSDDWTTKGQLLVGRGYRQAVDLGWNMSIRFDKSRTDFLW